MNESTRRGRGVRRFDVHRSGRASGPVPLVVRHVSRPYGRQHVKGVAIVRWLVAAWLVILGSVFCAYGQWWGTSLFALAGLLGYLAFQMPRWSPVLEAEDELNTRRASLTGAR